MPRFTLEIETEETDAAAFVEALAEADAHLPEFQSVRILAATDIVRLGGKLVLRGGVPDGVDPNGVLVVFVLDDKPLERSWVDCKVLPRRTEFLDLAEFGQEGVVEIAGVVWREHNLVSVVLARGPAAAADGEEADEARETEPPRGRVCHVGGMPDAETIADGDWDSRPGYGFAILEMRTADLRRLPLYKQVEVREPGPLPPGEMRPQAKQ